MRQKLVRMITDFLSEVASSSSSPRIRQFAESGTGEEQSLVPGISNELTIDRILTKVPWKTLYVLQSVSIAWRSAIYNRRVYDARVRNTATQTLVGLIHRAPVPKSGEPSLDNLYIRTMDHDTRTAAVPWWSQFAISLYDPVDKSWHQLPPIPHVRSGIPIRCGCVFLGGKLYVLGGDEQCNSRTRNEVYMFDLVAGPGEWQPCASMLSRRSDFPCGVIDGNILVSGGSAGLEAEMYDPKEDLWLPIADLLNLRTNHTMVTLDEQLYVLGGAVRYETEDDDGSVDIYADADFAEVYDPAKNRWKEVPQVLDGVGDHTLVVVDGKLYDFRHEAVDVTVYDVNTNSWTLSQPICWDALESMGASNGACCAITATAVDGELFALVRWQANFYEKLSVLKSRGFANKRVPLTWDGVLCPFKIDLNWPFLCTIKV
ncbi:hypothetical protein Mp_1g17330 [Marchantia polymorpha subsp. ruderalis]|uniref:F-box domain-containing protein n=2 Tax=Marchantia polymorpha TaxID=3197 RepID=A0AAF6AR65_MARPO|nr:hypothetical protein MARPO_0001s0073 [Marchantia polymorpha]BBM98935.1 hypothetical protein Mp_1g17330 [Marchantia polymorpha subsp. ruderalis]|eukprot:PTQ50013.1 hypothetical protein MARPO_0001s0073 [Marchantia polymorpha]